MKCEWVWIDIVNMEGMVGSRRLLVWDNTDFLTVWINWTSSDYTNQSFWVLESSWVSDLLDLISDLEQSNIRWLGPKNQSGSHELNPHYFTFAFRELENLFLDSLKSHLCKSEISCNQERLFVSEKTLQGFFINFRQNLFGKSDIFVYLGNLDWLIVPIE